MPIALRRLPWLLAPFVLVLLWFGAERIAQAGRVLRGVFVADVALSGLDRAQAERALQGFEQRIRQNAIRVRIHDQLFEIALDEVGFHLDRPRTWRAAFDAGRGGSFWRQLAWWLGRWLRPVRLEFSASIEQAQLEHALALLEERAIVDPAALGGVSARGGRVEPSYPRPGYEVDRAAAVRLINRRLSQLPSAVALPLPMRLIEPRLSRGAVDAAAAQGSALVGAPAQLIRRVPPAEAGARGETVVLRFTPAELAALLRSRIVGDERARIELYFDPRLIEQKLDEVRAKIEAKPKNASYEVDAADRLTLVPGRPGVELEGELVAEALLQAASSPARRAELPIVTGEPPQLGTEQVQRLGIRGPVAKFTTYHACCQPRVQNIHRIADLLDGTILLPGETFSVNAVIGPRTTRNGFVPAPSIEDGEMVDSVGGGISQFATTLFNAVFHGGYAILQRQPHSYYFSRYPMGHEATLGFPEPDLIFQNDSTAGLLIKTSYTATSISVRLYGDNGGRKVRADVSAPRDVVEPPIEYLPNSELSPSEEKVKEAGQSGWSVLVARVLEFPDGTSKREQRKVTYKARPRRVEVHPCKIPKGEPGHTGEPCPVEDVDRELAHDEAETPP